MTAALTTAKKFDLEALKSLAVRIGPCISLSIPDHHPGAQEGSRLAIFRNLLKNAEVILGASRLATEIRDPLARLWDMGQDVTLEQGGPGWTIFGAAQFVACYRTHVPFKNISVASHFCLSPFIATVSVPADLFVLGLSTKHLRILEYSHGECRDVELPRTVPRSLEAAGQFNRSERNLENRSAAGVSVGNLSRVRFGTTTDRDTPDAYLHDFFEIVDRELIPFLAGRPLVLMGVPEEIAAYRRAAGHRNGLIEGNSGNIELLSSTQVGSRAQEVALDQCFERGAAVLGEIREMRDRSRVITDVRSALHAASQGRVHQLCIRDATQWMSPMDPALDRTGLVEEDLVNATVVETLRTGGQVFAVNQDHLPASQPVAAALRY